jgi:hypothetical protein
MRAFSDLINNNPLVRYFKNVRNHFFNEFFINLSPKKVELPPGWYQKNHKEVCFSIAYNQTTCVEILIRSWHKYCHQTDLVIVDNSSNQRDRIQTESICKKLGAPYIGLPVNLEWSPNRSHALALNWSYYNLVLNWKPELFGFLDFDCFPFSEFDLRSSVSNFNVFGSKRTSRKNQLCWNVWPGFAFYRLSRLAQFKINFTHSIELGLDTGGTNWETLYSKLNPAEVRFVDSDSMVVQGLDEDITLSSVIHNSFLHIGSAGHKKKYITVDKIMQVLDKLNARKTMP